MPQNVTIFVDASFCPRTKLAGYGAWYRSPLFNKPVEMSGKLGQTRDNNKAEIIAVERVMRRIIEVHDKQECSELLFIMVLDSDTAIQCINNPDHNPLYTKCAKRVYSLLKNCGHRWKINPIKSHQSGNPRQWVNNRVDSLAKHQLNKQRKKHETQDI